MSVETTTRPFEPGTTGWTVADLDEPSIEAAWEAGAFEIVEGVLTKMPAAYYAPNRCFDGFVDEIKWHLRERRLPGRFVHEVDVVLSDKRVARADAVFMTPADEELQRQRVTGRRGGKIELSRIVVPPTLILESVSFGHESHDRETKRQWYAEAGIPNYWIFDALRKTIEVLVRDSNSYQIYRTARDDDEFESALFPGLKIPLQPIWA